MANAKSSIPMAGTIKIEIPGQDAQPVWMQKILRQALADGEGSRALRHQCRIAQDVNNSLAGSLEPPFVPDPQSKAQFGRNMRGVPFLTVGLINTESAVSVQLHWEGDAIPRKMIDAAIKHDEGRKVGATTITLDLSKGTHYILTPKEGGGPKSATGSTGPRKPRKRSYGRICRTDVEELGVDS